MDTTPLTSAPVHEMKPMLPSVSVMYKSAYHFFKKYFKAFAILALPLFVSVVLGDTLVDMSRYAPVGYHALGVVNLVIGNLLLALFTILSFLSPFAVIRTIKSIQETGVIIPLNEAYAPSFKGVGSYLWVVILTNFFAILASFFFIIPGIFIQIAFSFAIFALVFEDRKGFDALRSSWHYVKGYWWATFGRIIFVGIVLALMLAGFGIILGLISGIFVGMTKGYFVAGALTSLLARAVEFFIAMPFYLIFAAEIYRSLKSIKGVEVSESTTSDMKRNLTTFSILGGIFLVIWAVLFFTFIAPRIEQAVDRAMMRQQMHTQGSVNYRFGR